jgi:chromosome segregation ATPase
MRRLREQPRMTFATVVGLLCLVLIGIAIGTLVAGGDDDRARAAETRLASAGRALTARQGELRDALARVKKVQSALARAEKQTAALRRINRRLRRDLRQADRARHRRQRKK